MRQVRWIVHVVNYVKISLEADPTHFGFHISLHCRLSDKVKIKLSLCLTK
jgi:hypothetical protein